MSAAGTGPSLGLREALALAIVQKRKRCQEENVQWKEKALCARDSLRTLSVVIRRAANSSGGQFQGSDSQQGLLQAILQASQPPEDGTQDDVTTTVAAVPFEEHLVVSRADKLSDFVNTIKASALLNAEERGWLRTFFRNQQLSKLALALQAINLVKDMEAGNLSSIWEERNICRVSTAMEVTLLRLPSSDVRTSYLRQACEAILYLLDAGTCQHSPCISVLYCSYIAQGFTLMPCSSM